MAARRLLIVMLVLLGISTLAAALVPTQDLKDDETSSTATVGTETTKTQPPKPHPDGDHFDDVRITVGGTEIPVVKSVGDGVLDAGDRLTLTVACKCSDLVEIPAFGRIDAVAPGSPALFDLLLDEPGSYGIKLVTPDRVVARIEVEKRQDDEKLRPRAREE